MSQPATIEAETISLSLPIGRCLTVGGFTFERIDNNGFRLTKPVGVQSRVERMQRNMADSPAETPQSVG
jgi:hypothetical protein